MEGVRFDSQERRRLAEKVAARDRAGIDDEARGRGDGSWLMLGGISCGFIVDLMNLHIYVYVDVYVGGYNFFDYMLMYILKRGYYVYLITILM